MRRMSLLAMSLLVVLELSPAAHAADTMKPGLWEVVIKSDMTQQMPDIPPAQLEQMRKMGIEMPAKRDGGIVQRLCMTKEMVERNQTPGAGREQHDCKVGKQSRSGNSYRTEVVCDGANMKGTGVIKGTLNGSEKFSSTYDFMGTMRGQPLNQHHESSGKWISADCGNVKPLGEAMGAVAPKK